MIVAYACAFVWVWRSVPNCMCMRVSLCLSQCKHKTMEFVNTVYILNHIYNLYICISLFVIKCLYRENYNKLVCYCSCVMQKWKNKTKNYTTMWISKDVSYICVRQYFYSFVFVLLLQIQSSNACPLAWSNSLLFYITHYTVKSC